MSNQAETLAPKTPTFHDELTALLNKYSKENVSNTPDHILAGYLANCLENFNGAVYAREAWYGRHDVGPNDQQYSEDGTITILPKAKRPLYDAIHKGPPASSTAPESNLGSTDGNGE